MRINPKTEKQLTDESTLPRGVYEFEVIGAKESHSKEAHSPMIELKLKIIHAGRKYIVMDYLLESVPMKVRHAAQSCALMSEYDAGELRASSFVGKRGKKAIIIAKNGRNWVTDYAGMGGSTILLEAPKPMQKMDALIRRLK